MKKMFQNFGDVLTESPQTVQSDKQLITPYADHQAGDGNLPIPMTNNNNNNTTTDTSTEKENKTSKKPNIWPKSWINASKKMVIT